MGSDEILIKELQLTVAQVVYEGLKGIKTLEDWYRSGGHFMSKTQYLDLQNKIADAKRDLDAIKNN